MIEVSGLTRHRGKDVVLEKVSFKINNGSIYALLGAEGAGKSTLLALLAGGLLPHEGRVRVNGFDTATQPLKVKNCLAYVPCPTVLPRGMSVLQYLQFCARVRGIPFDRAVRRIKDATDMVGVRPDDRLPDRLSEAEKKAVAIAGALVGEVEFLLLDEPFAGLDAKARAEMEDLILELRSLGRTVILSTEEVAVATDLCDATLLLREGRLLGVFSAKELLARPEGDVLRSASVPSSEGDKDQSSEKQLTRGEGRH